MTKMLFWGEHGEYGPFSRQEDGWPHAGEVVRFYRRKRKMSAGELAKHYSEAIGTPISARWILKMEQQNKVPTDITRRRLLAHILEIPPVLMGLAALEELSPTSNAKASASITVAYKTFDLERYSEEARVFWKLHYAQTAQDALANLHSHISTLLSIQETASGSLARSVNELLNSYYRLAATIQRDNGNFEAAYTFANESVRSAQAIGSDVHALQIIAASQYTRGVVNLAWGVFGDNVKQGKTTLQSKKIETALLDFERALVHATPQLKGIIYSEMARAKALISTSPTDVTISRKLIEQAERFTDTHSDEDFYTQILLNGDLKGLDKRRLILGRAKTFLAIKRPEKTLEELDELEALNDGLSHTRRRAWTHILYAQASLDLGDYATTINESINAFNDCNAAHSLTHLARVNELHAQLLTSPYRNNEDVKRLGRLLKTNSSRE